MAAMVIPYERFLDTQRRRQTLVDSPAEQRLPAIEDDGVTTQPLTIDREPLSDAERQPAWKDPYPEHRT